ncbi:MAG TPA: CoA transferase, partial [Mycobacteriales bacterium]|nr:CoA transferase [Mycobacteriales bacterium]
FLSCNRNKESVSADLKSDEGRVLLTRLIRHSDVLVENFRPGVLDRLGFGVARLREINPRLVVLSITGFGHDGPDGGRAGYDLIAQGESGLMSLTGPSPDQPTRVGLPVGDVLAGVYGAYGVVAALHRRARTGHGEVVRTSLLAALVGVHAFEGTRYTVAGQVPRAQGNHHPSIAPYGAFRCADGIVQIAVGSEALWRRFAPLSGLDPDDPRFATNGERVRHRQELIAVIEAVFGTEPVSHWLDRLAGVGVPSGRVRSLDQVYEWDQVRSQGLLVDVDHDTLGPLRLPGPPLRFDTGGRSEHQAPPRLGQHDAPVRAWLDEVEALDRSEDRTNRSNRTDWTDGTGFPDRTEEPGAARP